MTIGQFNPLQFHVNSSFKRARPRLTLLARLCIARLATFLDLKKRGMSKTAPQLRNLSLDFYEFIIFFFNILELNNLKLKTRLPKIVPPCGPFILMNNSA